MQLIKRIVWLLLQGIPVEATEKVVVGQIVQHLTDRDVVVLIYGLILKTIAHNVCIIHNVHRVITVMMGQVVMVANGVVVDIVVRMAKLGMVLLVFHPTHTIQVKLSTKVLTLAVLEELALAVVDHVQEMLT